MIEDACHAVREFMTLKGVPVDVMFPVIPENVDQTYDVYSNLIREMMWIKDYALKQWHETGDVRHLRLSLDIEETAEHVDAMNRCDMVDVFDSILDKLYVAIGTGVTYGLPLCEGFTEVHRSNMSKQAAKCARISDKGATYSPPRLHEMLQKFQMIR